MDQPVEATSQLMIVYEALQLASSQDPVQLKLGETKLAQWETESGYYTTLHRIFTDHSAAVNVRWMAAVCFKNGITRYWRKNARNEIAAVEKSSLRALLISQFDEPVQQIATQIATLISLIARYDCPREWPELIPTLIETVRVTSGQPQHRALMVLQQVVKALSMKRLYADRKVFAQLTDTIYSFVLNIWDAFTNAYFRSVLDSDSGSVASIEYAEKAVLALRILRKLTIYGIERPYASKDCMLFLRSTFVRLRESLECRLQIRRKQQQQTTGLVELTEKFTLKLMKILNEFVEHHPISFVEFVPDALEFGFHFVFNEGTSMIFENNEIAFPNFAIHCINLMKGLLTSSMFYQSGSGTPSADQSFQAKCIPLSGNLLGAEVVNTDVEPDADWARHARNEFFTPVRISYICEKVIMHYFLLTTQDLGTWDADPESFSSDEGGESWKYALRPCTEAFFLALLNLFRDDMLLEIEKYIDKVQHVDLSGKDTDGGDLKAILQKDAIYNAAGLAAGNLRFLVDFDEWFRQRLSAELRISGQNFRIIRRRVMLLLGQWMTGKDLRPLVYAACLHSLNTDEDMCVRLTASKTLMVYVDDFDFDQDTFVEFLEPSFRLLFALLQSAAECDTKLQVLGIMSLIIDRMSDHIKSDAGAGLVHGLVQYLPRLWDESVEHNMLRCAIITTMVQIVKASENLPPELTAFLYPVIAMSTNKDDPSHIYLLEEGLELWMVVIENSSVLTADLLELSANLLIIIENTSENLRATFCIIQMYILLNPDVFLQHHGVKLVKTCQYLLTDMRMDGIVMVMKLYEECLRCKPDVALVLLRPAFADIFRKVADDDEFPLVLSTYMAIMARILIIDRQVFSDVLLEVQQSDPEHGSKCFENILDVWLARFSLVSQLEKRKLMCLSIASLLTAQNDLIYERFSCIMITVCQALNDIMKDDVDTNAYTDSLVYTDDGMNASSFWYNQDFDFNTHHYDRCRQLCLSDPVHTIELRKYLQLQLDTMRDQLGTERYGNLLATLDESVTTNLADFVRL